jgi:putative inorganic carbon (HCO3(-)) transporter
VTTVVSTRPDSPAVPKGRRPGESSTGITLAVCGALAVLAVLSGNALGDGSKAAVVLPLAAGLGLLLAGLAASRFGAYVLLMLALRSSIDLAKLSGSAAGTTESSASRALDPASLFAVLFLAASAMWLVGEYRRTKLPGSRLRTALVCFVFTCGISVVGSPHKSAGAMQTVRIAAAVAMFLVLEQLARRVGGSRRILLAVYASAIFPLALTTVTFLIGHGRTESKGTLDRATGPFAQSNEFGRYLMVLIVMGVALYPHLERRLQRALMVLLGLSSVFLFLTYTRTALIGTVVGLVIVGIVQSKRVLVGLFVAAVLGLAVVPGVAGRFTDLAPTTSSSAGTTSSNSLAWRFSYWTEVLPLANKNPVTGIGLNETQYNTDQAKQPHNDFLRAYVETGLLGLGAYIAALAGMVGLGIRSVRRSVPGTFERGAAAGFLACAVAFVAVSAVANVISNVVVLWYLFAYAAVAASISSQPSPMTRKLEA